MKEIQPPERDRRGNPNTKVYVCVSECVYVCVCVWGGGGDRKTQKASINVCLLIYEHNVPFYDVPVPMPVDMMMLFLMLKPKYMLPFTVSCSDDAI